MSNKSLYHNQKDVGVQQTNDKNQQLRTLQHTSVYKGMLPPPEMMASYNAIDSTFANRIVAMAEKDLEHSHYIDKKKHAMAYNSMIFGICSALISVSILGYLAYYAINNGYPNAGATIVVGAMAAIAGVFMYRKKTEN